MESYTQQDEVEKLKSWWKNYGNSLLVGLVLGIAILFGNKYWDKYQERQSAEASSLYEQLLTSIKNRNAKASKETSGKLITEYKSTPYAAMAALLMAKVNYDNGDVSSASSQLRWAVDNAREDTLEHVARLRLARVLLGQGKVKEAGKLVSKISDDDMGGHKSEYYEVRGDILLKQGELAKAKKAYQSAIESTDKTSAYRTVLSMKLDSATEIKP